MCEVHLQYGNSTTKWRFYTFFDLIPLYTYLIIHIQIPENKNLYLNSPLTKKLSFRWSRDLNIIFRYSRDQNDTFRYFRDQSPKNLEIPGTKIIYLDNLIDKITYLSIWLEYGFLIYDINSN